MAAKTTENSRVALEEITEETTEEITEEITEETTEITGEEGEDTTVTRAGAGADQVVADTMGIITTDMDTVVAEEDETTTITSSNIMDSSNRRLTATITL